MKHYLYDKISSFIMRGCNDLHICDWAFYLPCESLLYYALTDRGGGHFSSTHITCHLQRCRLHLNVPYHMPSPCTSPNHQSQILCQMPKFGLHHVFLLSNNKKGTIFKKLQLIRTYIDKPLPGRKKSHYSFTNFYWTHS